MKTVHVSLHVHVTLHVHAKQHVHVIPHVHVTHHVHVNTTKNYSRTNLPTKRSKSTGFVDLVSKSEILFLVLI